MRFIIPKLAISVEYFLRACGYIEIKNPHKNNENSYARSIHSGNFYPRFHVYPVKKEIAANEISLDLHLDAKQPSYEGAAAHSGEYDGPIVVRESERIKQISNEFIPPDSGRLKQPIGFSPKKSLWQKIKNYFK